MDETPELLTLLGDAVSPGLVGSIGLYRLFPPVFAELSCSNESTLPDLPSAIVDEGVFSFVGVSV